MKNDFLQEVDCFGLTARLKRLSDSLLYSSKDLYSSQGLEIDPNWHLVFLILKKHKKMTMSEMAEAFQLSQTAVIKIINKMSNKGYLIATKDKSDNRKQQLQLSDKAMKELPKLNKIWEAGRKTIEDLLEDNRSFLAQLEKLEVKVKQSTYKERTLDHLKSI